MNQAARWLRNFLLACLMATMAVTLLSAHPQSPVAPTTIAGASAKPVIYGYDRTLNNVSAHSLVEGASVDDSTRSATRPSALVWSIPSPGALVVAAETEGAALADEAPAFARSQYGRPTVAERAGAFEKAPTCPYCGEAPSSQVDHISALRQDWGAGGWADDFATRTARINDPGNLIGACGPCNAAKGARAIGEGAGQWWPSGWPSGSWWPFGGP